MKAWLTADSKTERASVDGIRLEATGKKGAVDLSEAQVKRLRAAGVDVKTESKKGNGDSSSKAKQEE